MQQTPATLSKWIGVSSGETNIVHLNILRVMSFLALLPLIVSNKKASGPAVPLVDGLLVTGRMELWTLTANWILLIVLDAPLPPDDMATQIHQLEANLTILCQMYGINPSYLSSWKNRLQWVDNMAGHSHFRVWRGLFDLGGIILDGLFGVATKEDLSKYDKVVAALRKDTNAIIHIILKLTSAMSQTRIYVQEK